MLTIGLDRQISIVDQVKKAFTQANEWQTFEDWSGPHNKQPIGCQDKIIHSQQHEFVKSYYKIHPKGEGIEQFQAMFFIVPEKDAEHTANLFADQFRNTRTRQTMGEPTVRARLTNYEENKKIHYPHFDSEGKDIMTLSIIGDKLPSEMDKNGEKMVCVGVFIHSQLRAMVAADLLQQQVAHRFR